TVIKSTIRNCIFNSNGEQPYLCVMRFIDGAIYMELNWFQQGPIPANVITGTYNYGLVGLSYIIAILASYVALDLAGRIRSEETPHIQLYWLLGGAFAMGAGIWSMHFIGMLAFIMPMPMTYE